MAKKWYGVKSGNQIGVFDNWADCQKSINGFSGAQYKGFATKEEAEGFVWDNVKEVVSEEVDKGDLVEFYVDGSFMDNKVGYGVVAVKDGEILFKDCGSYKGKDVSLANVTGEVMGSMRAIQLSKANGFKNIVICYDYLGVEYWVNGSWKANTDLTKEYVKYMNKHMKNLSYVGFRKIKAHTGNEFNDIADEMAKLGTTL